MRQSIHNRMYVRTPDVSIYSPLSVDKELKKPATAERSFRLPRHAEPLKYREELLANFTEEDKIFYRFPTKGRTTRMSHEDFYKDFECAGKKSNIIISNFLECYLERKIKKEAYQFFVRTPQQSGKTKQMRNRKCKVKSYSVNAVKPIQTDAINP